MSESPTAAIQAGTAPTARGGLESLDWLVLGAYLLLLLVTAMRVRSRARDANAYFVGERNMPVWAVSLSVIATAMSAASFIGVPAQAFAGDLSYLSANLGAILAVVVVAAYFIPAFYRYQVVTVYELIGRRFGRPAAMAASWTFLAGRVFANGSRLFIAAMPLALLLAGDRDGAGFSDQELKNAILALAGIGTLYALIGGISSVIWTEVVQMVVLLGAAISALILLLTRIPLSLSATASLLSGVMVGHDHHGAGHSKLTVFSLSLDAGESFTLFTAISGWLLLNLAAYGADQDLAQRMLTCRNALSGGRSALGAIIAGIPVQLLFMAIGLLLCVFYSHPEVMGPPRYAVPGANQAFLTFILREMPAGLRGLMLSGLFAVAFTSLLSALNAMAATSLNDCYRPLMKHADPARDLRIGRLAVVLWGTVLGGFACMCVDWQRSNHEGLLEFALGVMSFAYAGLLAVFLTALFTRRGNTVSAIAALVTGFLVVSALQPFSWQWFSDRPLVLAAPWRLLIGTALSFLVCLAGRPAATPPAAADAGAPSSADTDAALPPRQPGPGSAPAETA
jgi:SSS family solute:Na+ symporter